MHNPHFDISGILGKQLSADIAQQALGAIDMPTLTPDVRKIADIEPSPRIMELARGIFSQENEAQDHLKAAMSGLGDTSTQMASLQNALNLDAGGTIAERLYKDYGITGGILGKNYAAQAAGALGKDAAFMGGVPKIADFMGGVPKIADLMNDYNVLPKGLMDSLGKTFDIYNVASPAEALRVAQARPDVQEAAEEAVEDHPEAVDELSIAVTGRSLADLGEMKRSELISLVEAIFGAVGGTVVVGVTAGSAPVMILVICVALVSFGLRVQSIEASVEERREASGGEE